MTKGSELSATPEPHALIMNSTAVTIRQARRPKRSARRPAKKAPAAQPSSIELTLNPVPALSDWRASWSPSTVPLMTPMSKPKRKPPITATRQIKRV